MRNRHRCCAAGKQALELRSFNGLAAADTLRKLAKSDADIVYRAPGEPPFDSISDDWRDRYWADQGPDNAQAEEDQTQEPT